MARHHTISARPGRPQKDAIFTTEEEAARDAEEAAVAAEEVQRVRAAGVARVLDLETRLVAAQRLAAVLPEAAAEADRLTRERDAALAEINADTSAAATPRER